MVEEETKRFKKRNSANGYLNKIGFKDTRFMNWIICSPDHNPIENLWSIVKRKARNGRRQFPAKNSF